MVGMAGTILVFLVAELPYRYPLSVGMYVYPSVCMSTLIQNLVTTTPPKRLDGLS